MELELADLQSKKPAPAGPIATPAPAEAPAATPAAPDTQSNVPPVIAARCANPKTGRYARPRRGPNRKT